VSDDQPRFDRIFTAQNMEIRSADGGERDPDDSFAYASTRAWDCFDLNVMRAVEDGRTHRVRFHIFQHFHAAHPKQYPIGLSSAGELTAMLSTQFREHADIDQHILLLGRRQPISPCVHGTEAQAI